MKSSNNGIWGLALIVFGLFLALRAFNLANFDLFFNGWWTLFIIVPCFIGLFSTNGKKLHSLCGLVIGVDLLLGAQGVLKPGVSTSLLFPIVIVFLGIYVIMNAQERESASGENLQHHAYEGQREYATLFSGQDIDLGNQLFQGASLKAMFGGFRMDLRNAVIEEGAVLNVQCLFGGVDLFVPEDVNIELSANNLCGGIENKGHKNPGAGFKTIYLNTSCMFGGISIKCRR